MAKYLKLVVCTVIFIISYHLMHVQGYSQGYSSSSSSSLASSATVYFCNFFSGNDSYSVTISLGPSFHSDFTITSDFAVYEECVWMPGVALQPGYGYLTSYNAQGAQLSQLDFSTKLLGVSLCSQADLNVIVAYGGPSDTTPSVLLASDTRAWSVQYCQDTGNGMNDLVSWSQSYADRWYFFNVAANSGKDYVDLLWQNTSAPGTWQTSQFTDLTASVALMDMYEPVQVLSIAAFNSSSNDTQPVASSENLQGYVVDQTALITVLYGDTNDPTTWKLWSLTTAPLSSTTPPPNPPTTPPQMSSADSFHSATAAALCIILSVLSIFSV